MFKNLWYWRLAIFECFTDAYVAGVMVWLSAVANDDWENLSSTAKKAIYLYASIAVIKVIKSFLSTTMAVLKEAQPIILKPGEKSVEQTHVEKVGSGERTVSDVEKTVVEPK